MAPCNFAFSYVITLITLFTLITFKRAFKSADIYNFNLSAYRVKREHTTICVARAHDMGERLAAFVIGLVHAVYRAVAHVSRLRPEICHAISSTVRRAT